MDVSNALPSCACYGVLSFPHGAFWNLCDSTAIAETLPGLFQSTELLMCTGFHFDSFPVWALIDSRGVDLAVRFGGHLHALGCGMCV
jgi:hypothetical protein